MNPDGTPRNRRLVPLLVAWGALIALDTLSQIALKMAGKRVGPFDLDRSSILAAVSTPWLWLALACYLGQFAAWMTILEKSALSAAFPITAITFVAVMLASWAVFGDPMGWEKLLGSAIIVAGILLLGGDTEPGPSAPPRNDAEGKSP